MFHAVVQRAAVLSLHTSPLAQPGSGDSGGMNVYVRELVSALSQAGVECTTYTRRTSADQPEVVVVEPKEGHGFRDVDNNVNLYTKMLAFFDKYIGAGAKAAPSAPAASP